MWRPNARYHSVDWSLSALLTIQAITLFVAIPLGTQYHAAHILLDTCRLAFALISITAFARHRALQMVLIAAWVLLTAGSLAGRLVLESIGLVPSASLVHDLIGTVALAFNAAVTLLVAGHVFGPGRVTMHRVQGAVLIYLNIAALFALVFSTILSLWPAAMATGAGAPLPSDWGARTAALTYFSLTTITTTGYGDLAPVHPLMRSLANLEAVIGQLFPATLLARIVALNIEHSRRAGIDPQTRADAETPRKPS